MKYNNQDIMNQKFIKIKGAKEHNLKNIDVNIPKDQLVVITGVSGSGKSSLAFDTIYAEGQRRYVESLSAYARQFLGRMEKPDVEYIEGLSPSISIDQKGVSHNPRSTVGTVTEIYDYLRLLFARIGKPHCHICGNPVTKQTIQQISDSLMKLPENSRLTLLAPKISHKKGVHKEVIDTAKSNGFIRMRIDGDVISLDDSGNINLERNKWHYLDLVVDRLIIKPSLESTRLTESIETCLKEGDGILIASVGTNDDLIYSEKFACVNCDISLTEMEPRTFSFNSPHGACDNCSGLGYNLSVEPYLVTPNPELSLIDGAIAPWSRLGRTSTMWYKNLLESLSDKYKFDLMVPFKELPENVVNLLMFGDTSEKIQIHHRTRRGKKYVWDVSFDGIVANLERRFKETKSDYTKSEITKYMAESSCADCNGNRLKKEVLAVTILNKNIMDICNMSIGSSLKWVTSMSTDSKDQLLSEYDQIIADQIIREILVRLNFLNEIGLDYISLNRTAKTLSGGEAQRVRLATQIGSGLTGVLYVCDEPTIGLHPHDDSLLIQTLKNLKNLGNTVIVVEHDETMMKESDYIVDMGPGAGEYGGEVVAVGTIQDIMDNPRSLTGQYLSKQKNIACPEIRRNGNGHAIQITHCTGNNLKNINTSIPLGTLTCVTGVSGSGKSTLAYETIYKALAQRVSRSKEIPGAFESITGTDEIDKIINIDQSPIGRTPRSNPATYTGLFTPIRDLFAQLPESKIRGYTPGRFSFNVKGGRCESCEGAGYIQIEMQFLPDVTIPCSLCLGARYNREALQIEYHGFNISDILNMTVDKALDFFQRIPRIRSKLETMQAVGLGYIRLGQPATTLSGGEAQRIKLSTELSKRSTGKTFYMLDEPTTGLSFDDCNKLILVLHKLVDQGNSVLLIEHNMDIIKNADWIIDLGPGAGDKGGYIVGSGTPESLSENTDSKTGTFLKPLLNPQPVY
jgi:excinuclease ABC subunit A